MRRCRRREPRRADGAARHAGITSGAPEYDASHFKVSVQRMYEVGRLPEDGPFVVASGSLPSAIVASLPTRSPTVDRSPATRAVDLTALAGWPRPVTPLQLYTEPFSPNGNVTAEGVINQLGRPTRHPLAASPGDGPELLGRARERAGRCPVLQWMAGRRHRSAQSCGRSSLRCRTAPPLAASWARRLSTDDQDYLPRLRLLAVSDRGTIGLGGPTRADARAVRANPATSSTSCGTWACRRTSR